MAEVCGYLVAVRVPVGPRDRYRLELTACDRDKGHIGYHEIADPAKGGSE